MRQMKKEFGRHYLIELIHCETKKLKFVKEVKKIFLKSAHQSKAKIIRYFFHQYKPSGVTGIILICESHFSIHTWPEDRYAAVDIQTCGHMNPEAAIKELKKEFKVKKIRVKMIRRGT